MMIRGTRRYPLHIYLSALFVTLIVLFLGVTIIVADYGIRRLMLDGANKGFRQDTVDVREDLEWRYNAAATLVEMLVQTRLARATTLEQRLDALGLLAQPLMKPNILTTAYVGYANGDFILFRRLEPELVRSLDPPSAAKYMVQAIERDALGQREGRYLFYDAALRQVENRLVPNYDFNPRSRPWFHDAMASDETIVTAPYGFATVRLAGITIAHRSQDGQAVAAIDVRLNFLSELLDRLRPTPSAELILFNDRSEVLADANRQQPLPLFDGVPLIPQIHDLGRAALDQVFARRTSAGDQIFDVEEAEGTWHGLATRIAMPGAPLYLAIVAPRAELMAGAIAVRNQMLTLVLGLLVLAVLCTFVVARLAARALAGLTREAAAIRALRFDQPVAVRSMISEIDTLAVTMDGMKSTIRRFLEIGAGLADERNFNRLLDRILTETIQIASARGGLIYLAAEDGTLTCELARWEKEPIEKPPTITDSTGQPEHPAVRPAREGSISVLADTDAITEWFPAVHSPEPLAILAVPLRTRQGVLLGALVLLQDPAATSGATEHDVVALVEAVSGTASAAIDAQRLALEQKNLLQSFIELVAGAIDRKSPYTGGHCQRVPELTKMIARAAEAATDGPFANFALDETQWEELHIAAWLHDCGKVTSPEFVVDKATKLETIYDRLHEVRMRFELIKREAEVLAWQDVAKGADMEARLAELRSFWAILDGEFGFIASCNEGGEYMAPEKIERLKDIARRTWTRTLDDRIGLGAEEMRRKASVPVASLPAPEPLLADRPEHIFERPEADKLSPDNPWGFKVEVPAHLYNRGEIHNLSIGRGTLAAEDRYKINEHIIETIRMLSRLPWPRHLRSVAEFAGAHHERVDGKGYPRQLRGEQMSIPARMMAIADIFEALTAADRPYKKSKTLSEALAIMGHMSDEGHIDPDLFELFISAGVYQAYAEEFLSREQIDVVDISRYANRKMREPA